MSSARHITYAKRRVLGVIVYANWQPARIPELGPRNVSKTDQLFLSLDNKIIAYAVADPGLTRHYLF